MVDENELREEWNAKTAENADWLRKQKFTKEQLIKMMSLVMLDAEESRRHTVALEEDAKNIALALKVYSSDSEKMTAELRVGLLELMAEANNMAAKALLAGVKLQKSSFAKRIGAAGGKSRQSAMGKLSQWVLSRYKSNYPLGKKQISANAAAHSLVECALEHSRQISANLTPTNAQRTIAEWIRKANKSV